MPDPVWTATHSFTDGAARYKDLCYFSLTQDNLTESEVPHTVFVGIDEGEWYQYSHVGWASVGLVFVTEPSQKALAAGEEGQIWTYFNGQEGYEHIEGCSLLRNLSIVDGEAYGCGMNRQVFRRNGEGMWIAMHAPSPESGETLGFEALDGYSHTDIYAAGWEGEIWNFDGNKWKSCDSPTNLILTGIHCAPDKHVYACGQEGSLLRGNSSVWKDISDENVRDDFWDVISFNNSIYVASKTAIYELKNGSLEMVMPTSDRVRTAGRFTTREGFLWSIGDKDVFFFDGSVWTRAE